MTDHFSMPDKAINEMFQARSPMCIGLHGISALPASPTTAISPPPPRPLLVSSISGILSHGFPGVGERKGCLGGGHPPQEARRGRDRARSRFGLRLSVGSWIR